MLLRQTAADARRSARRLSVGSIPEGIVPPVHQRMPPSRAGDPVLLVRALGQMAADETHHLAHMRIIPAIQRRFVGTQDLNDSSPGGMPDALAAAALEADGVAFGGL